jgi:hypothetical protein
MNYCLITRENTVREDYKNEKIWFIGYGLIHGELDGM